MVPQPARSFTDLVVWQKAHALVLQVYHCSARFPKSEAYGLMLQIRRAAVSIPANIAEGFKKRSPSDKARFLNIAQGSLEEVRYYLILVRDLHYLDSGPFFKQLDEVGRLLEGYASRIREKAEFRRRKTDE